MKTALFNVFFASNYITVAAENEKQAIKIASKMSSDFGYKEVAKESQIIDFVAEYDITYYNQYKDECVLPAHCQFDGTNIIVNHYNKNSNDFVSKNMLNDYRDIISFLRSSLLYQEYKSFDYEVIVSIDILSADDEIIIETENHIHYLHTYRDRDLLEKIIDAGNLYIDADGYADATLDIIVAFMDKYSAGKRAKIRREMKKKKTL